jgi:cholesterol oxidase
MLDYVIIGSGFGGAVAACRLARRGREVLVLERGRRWAPADFPRRYGDAWLWSHSRPERCHGWIDMRVMDQMTVVQGAGVGGGSLIYANVSIDAEPEAFASGWPSAITHDALKPYYERVADMLRPERIADNQLTERFKLMREAADAIGEGQRFRKLELAISFDPDWTYEDPDRFDTAKVNTFVNAHGKVQGRCRHLGLCDIGCPIGAKNTLDFNYLAAAEADGATIQPLSLVSHVSNLGSAWRVHYERLEDGRREEAFVDAKRVIVAAGSLGSTEILLRSRDQYRTLTRLPRALGHGWSSNGDFLTPAYYPGRRIAPTEGPTITAAVDFLDGSEKGARFFVEDGGFPNVLTRLLGLGAPARAWLALRHLRYAPDYIMPWFGQGYDGGDGRLYLGRSALAPWRRCLKMDWNPERSIASIQGLADMHVKLSRATNGKPLPVLAWKYLRSLITPHPLGGCNMAMAGAAGVVDDECRVHGHDGLFVMDGSVIPRPLGLNPSKTIAAVAERAVATLIAE